MFACCDNQYATVAGVRSTEGWRIRFRRPFGLDESVEWDNLCRIFDLHPISTGGDEVSWVLESSGQFSTNSIYHKLTQGAAVAHFKQVWKTKVPPKFRVSLWLLLRGRLPAGDQLAKRRGPSDGSCALCGEWEDCDHIFFKCHLAKFMWAGVRELLNCSWDPTGVGDFVSIVQGLAGPMRRLVWFTFTA